ncbi:MAG: hypothetical protein KH828_01670 [Clostridiales bacterium]|nr:hypothetical protein [Clostridiales bacterium]
MSLEFKDNRTKVKEALDDAITAFLIEAGGELQGKTVRNSRKDQSHTAGSYEYKVDESEGVCQIGSNLENSIWEEFGTGEYALHGDGRKGGWYIPEENLTAKAKSKMKKVIGKNGKVYYFTRGKTPNRPMQRAFDSSKMKLIRRFGQILTQRFSK